MLTDHSMGHMFLFHLCSFDGSFACLNNRCIDDAKDAQHLPGNRKEKGKDRERGNENMKNKKKREVNTNCPLSQNTFRKCNNILV